MFNLANRFLGCLGGTLRSTLTTGSADVKAKRKAAVNFIFVESLFLSKDNSAFFHVVRVSRLFVVVVVTVVDLFSNLSFSSYRAKS